MSSRATDVNSKDGAMPPLALVGTYKYPRSAEPRHPAIDATGAVVLTDEDGSPTRISVPAVAPFNRSLGRELNEFNSASGFAKLTWTVTLTGTRVLFTAPEVVGIYGGVKSKGGHITAGQLRYQWLGSLAWGVDTLWLATPMANGQKQDRIGVDQPGTLESGQAGELVSELISRVVTYWQTRGRDCGRLENALSTFKADPEPSSVVDIDDLLKADGEAWGPVSVAP